MSVGFSPFSIISSIMSSTQASTSRQQILKANHFFQKQDNPTKTGKASLYIDFPGHGQSDNLKKSNLELIFFVSTLFLIIEQSLIQAFKYDGTNLAGNLISSSEVKIIICKAGLLWLLSLCCLEEEKLPTSMVLVLLSGSLLSLLWLLQLLIPELCLLWLGI